MALSAFIGGPEAQARPQYTKAFIAAYPALKTEAEAAKCGICHPEEKKAVRNDYGKALGAALPEKNTKGEEALAEALKKIESEKGETDGKTFGELIKEGKLPGKK
ncbi:MULTISPECIES: hypothetical protein [unclassified Schlesneria]|uniref:hypothetical protein n=1 Tax=Schlesneria TaxID=656899 RepID=UPI002F095E96